MIKEKYVSVDYIVSIEEDEQLYFYALKDGEDIGCALIIKVHMNVNGKKGEYRGYYHRIWEYEVTTMEINAFIKNILEKPEYRKEYLREGIGFEGVIPYTDDSGVNMKCKNAIEVFYKTRSKKGFKDYIKLKTYGADRFSRMKIEKMAELLDESSIVKVKGVLEDDKLVLSALRWCCRGLLVDDAIRKVKTDLEVAMNKR